MKKRLKKKIIKSVEVLDRKRLTAKSANTAYGRLLLLTAVTGRLNDLYPFFVERPKFRDGRHYYLISEEAGHNEFYFMVCRADTVENSAKYYSE